MLDSHRVVLVLLTLATFTAIGGGASAQPTWRVHVDSAGVEGNGNASNEAFLSADGRYVAFASHSSNLVVGDTNGASDIFVHDRVSKTTRRVSVSSTGVEGKEGTSSLHPAISADGRFVAFWSSADNLVPNDVNMSSDVFVHDTQTGITELASISSTGVQADRASLDPALSADGRFVVFGSDATNLVANDTNGVRDVFLRDRQTGTTTRVSVKTGGGQANGLSRTPSISGDGRFVGFASRANDLVAGDTNGVIDTFVHDRQTVTTERVSVSSAGVEGDIKSYRPWLSFDGRFVAFKSSAMNLVPNDTNGKDDVFVRDRQLSTTTRVSVSSTGAQGNDHAVGANDSEGPVMSDDGRFVVFHSDASNMVPGDLNGVRDVFVHDRQTQTTTLVSRDSAGRQANGASTLPAISGDGRFVVMLSDATNLVPSDTNSATDVFVRDRIDLAFNGTPAHPGLVNFSVSSAFGELGNLGLVLLSCSGISPGFPLPANDGRTVYLNPDPCTDIGLAFGVFLQGTVDATGTATTPLFPFPVVPSGITVHAAAVTVGNGAFVSITSPTSFVTQ